VYFIAFGAAVLVVGVGVVAARRGPPLRAIAVLLVVEASVLAVTTSVEWTSVAPLVAFSIATLVVSLATTGSVIAFAFAQRSRISVLAALTWTAWWVSEAVLYLWVVEAAVRGPSEPPNWGLYSCMFGFCAASFVVGAVHGTRKRIGTIIVVFVAFLIVWLCGRVWMWDTGNIDGPDDMRSLRHFSNVGYVGWHIVLAVMVWRASVGNLPPARVVTDRTVSPRRASRRARH